MLWGLIGVYHTQFILSCIVAFLSKMFDDGDLPVLTFSNCVLKAGPVIKWPVKL